MTLPNSDIPTPVDDGLICPEVGRWARTKYRLISLYDALFSTGMKDKWDVRFYLDLYAGAGYNKIRGTSTIVFGSPLLAINVKHPFDKYIFCEEAADKLEALKQRTKRLAPNADVTYIAGDCNSKINDILKAIPRGSKELKVLGLCLVDPYDLGIKIETLRLLSSRFIDFLCLLALSMDARRNYQRYVEPESKKVDDFLGDSEWRKKWATAQASRIEFPKFLAVEFADRMRALDYIPPPLYTMKEVRSDEKNLPLYHLALFSRSQRAYDFWGEVLKYSTEQTVFSFEG